MGFEPIYVTCLEHVAIPFSYGGKNAECNDVSEICRHFQWYRILGKLYRF